MIPIQTRRHRGCNHPLKRGKGAVSNLQGRYEVLVRIMAAAAEAGAINASYVVLRLPWEVSPLFRQWLQAHFPNLDSRFRGNDEDLVGWVERSVTHLSRFIQH